MKTFAIQFRYTQMVESAGGSGGSGDMGACSGGYGGYGYRTLPQENNVICEIVKARDAETAITKLRESKHNEIIIHLVNLV